MGIKDLTTFLKQFGIETKMVYSAEKAPLAIDMHNLIYTHSISAAKAANSLESFNVQIYKNILKIILKLYQMGIKPILVWDGYTLYGDTSFDEFPKKERAASNQKFPLYNDQKELIELNLDRRFFTKFREFITECGFEHVVSRNESERTAALLVKKGLASAVYTRDSDVIAMGVNMVTSIPRISSKLFFEGYVYDDLLQKLISYRSETKTNPDYQCITDESDFRKACILLGTDYNDRIPRNGPVHIYNKLHNLSFDERHEVAIRFFNLDVREEVVVNALDITKLTAMTQNSSIDVELRVVLINILSAIDSTVVAVPISAEDDIEIIDIN